MHGRRRNEIRSAAFQVRMWEFPGWTEPDGTELALDRCISNLVQMKSYAKTLTGKKRRPVQLEEVWTEKAIPTHFMLLQGDGNW